MDDIDYLSNYAKDIKQEYLTSEQEIELSKRVLLDSDREAVNKLVECNLFLVINISKRFVKNNNLMDLIQAGNLGLIRAAEKFDWRRGCRFSTYAYPWILQAVIKNDYYGIKIPMKIIRLNRNTDKMIRGFFLNNSRPPTNEEIQLLSGLEDRELEKMRLPSVSYFSQEDENNIPKYDDTDAELLNNDLHDVLRKEMDIYLNTREKYILANRIMEDPKDLEELGKDLRLSTNRIRQIEREALKKMSHSDILKKYIKGI